MSRQKAKPVKGIAKRRKSTRRTGIKAKPLPTRTAWVKIHIPSLHNDDVSWCGMVHMVWTHLICIPRVGDSIEELVALRVCSNCARYAAEHYELTD